MQLQRLEFDPQNPLKNHNKNHIHKTTGTAVCVSKISAGVPETAGVHWPAKLA